MSVDTGRSTTQPHPGAVGPPPGRLADAFAHYLDSLVGSWRALASPHPGATVTRGNGFVVSRFPSQPVFNNAVLLDPAVLPQVLAAFAGTASYAVWSADLPSGPFAGVDVVRALEETGLRRDVTTTPMVLPGQAMQADASADSVDPAGSAVEVRKVSPRVVAAINGVGAELLQAVPGLLAYATADGSSGLVLIPVGTDVNVSFVATRPDQRRRGLASLVLRFALADALERGFLTASLQATPMAQSLYAAAGFESVGHFQEWVPSAA